jgi:hypothetical protein
MPTTRIGPCGLLGFVFVVAACGGTAGHDAGVDADAAMPDVSVEREAGGETDPCSGRCVPGQTCVATLFRASEEFLPQAARPGYSVALADVTGDGVPDLITAAQTEVLISVGRGDGTFDFVPSIMSPIVNAASLAVGDVNHDGHLDLVVASVFDSEVNVLLGAGDGHFGAPQTFPTVGRTMTPVLGDVDGDGVLDIVAPGLDGLAVLLGRGDGTFGPPALVPGVAGASALALADMNGDGRLDAAFVDNTDTVWIYLGTGGGSFSAAQSYVTGGSLVAIAAHDMNGDGQADVVVADTMGSAVDVLLGRGDGSFAPAGSFATHAAPGSLAIADMDRDGRGDVLTVNQGTADVSILLGNGDGTLGAARSFASSPRPAGLAVADLNGDGAPDVAVGGTFDLALLGVGDGTLMAGQTFAVGVATRTVAFADLNGDRHLDMLVDDSGSHDVVLLAGDGSGGFSPADTVTIAGAGFTPYAMAVADFDGDGRPDFVAQGAANSIVVFLQDTAGGWQQLPPAPVSSSPNTPLVADFNHDGRPDVAAFGRAGVSVLLGNGDGTFADHVDFAAGFPTSHAAIADFNLDGADDLVLVTPFPTLHLLLGDGHGGFRDGPDVTATGSRGPWWPLT